MKRETANHVYLIALRLIEMIVGGVAAGAIGGCVADLMRGESVYWNCFHIGVAVMCLIRFAKVIFEEP